MRLAQVALQWLTGLMVGPAVAAEAGVHGLGSVRSPSTGERAERPAGVQGRRGGPALAPFAGCTVKPPLECASKMGGVLETSGEGNLGHALAGALGFGEVGRRLHQAPAPDLA